MPSTLVLIANGTEEMEFTITYDVLIRAGIKTTSAYVPDVKAREGTTDITVSPPAAKGSRGINILPDMYFDIERCGTELYDALVIPGGANGADTMSKHPGVQHLIRKFIQEEKVVGMICAGSLAALTSNLLKQPLTSHPSVKAQLEKDFEYKEDSVVVSDGLITSRGPGTAFAFALTLVELLCGKEKRAEVSKPMVFPPGTPW